MQRDAVPLFQIPDVGVAQVVQLLLRVVDQRGQLIKLRAGDAVGKERVQRLADHAGAGIENVQKGLMLPMDIGDEVLAALGQVHDGLQVDDLRGRRADRGKHAGEHLQIAQVIFRVGAVLCHRSISFFT